MGYWPVHFIESYAHQSDEPIMDQGIILISSETYYLCISPLCDLYRLSIGSHVTFLTGSLCERPDSISSAKKFAQTSVLINNTGPRSIVWDLSDVYSHEIKVKHAGFANLSTSDFSEFAYVGKLRPDITQRIIHRAWSQRTRVGTDILEVIRLTRGED